MDRPDRRTAPRFGVGVPTELRYPVGPQSEGWGRITNISASGLFIETRFPLKVGAVVYVSFGLTGGTRFDSLRTRVIRSRFEDGYYAGAVAFDDVVDRETLRDVLGALANEGSVGVEDALGTLPGDKNHATPR